MGRLGRDRARPCWQPAEPSKHPLGDGKANMLCLLKTGSRASEGRTGNFRATKEGSMWSGHWIGPVMSTVELGLLVLVTLAEFGSGEEEGILDTYWSGTAPICLGGCKGKHQELKRSQCGNGSCCWLGYKSFCRVNCGRPETDFNSVAYGNDWWVGSVVRYSCRSGFLLVGDPASACQSDGRWTPKPTCLRICLRGQIEINERDIDGSCSSSCTKKAHLGAFLNHGCIKISNCVTKQRGWMRWFTRCDFCECDCYIPCSSSG